MFKALTETAKIPERATTKSVGYDLVTLGHEWSDNGTVITYRTGIAIGDIPEGYFAALFPRSSIVNYDLRLANSVGVIDPDYDQEILVKFDVPLVAAQVLARGDARIYKAGDKIAQLVILPYLVGNDIQTQKRVDGFGSTDKPKKGSNGRKDNAEGNRTPSRN